MTALENLDEVVKTAVTERTHAAIVASLEQDAGKLVSAIVTMALEAKTKVKGTYREASYIEAVAHEVIQEQAKAAIGEWAVEHAGDIRAELERQLGTARVKRQIAGGLVDLLVKQATKNFHYTFKMDVHNADD